jgi:hypothetical protein
VKRYKAQSLIIIVLLLVVPLIIAAAEKPAGPVLHSDASGRRDISLVVYNGNLALVREVRSVPGSKGLFELQFHDVARQIQPSSVLIDTGEDVKVLEQRYTYDLLSVQSLLERFIGKTVVLERTDERTNTTQRIEGTLLSLDGGRIVRFGDRVEIDPEGRFILPEVPQDLTSRPTLTWLMRGKGAGQSRIEVSYLTGGINWNCDYVLSLTGESSGTLSGWVTLDNRSGSEFPECELTLVAGEINKVPTPRPMVDMAAARAPGVMKSFSEAGGEGFQRETLMDYHRYTLGRCSGIDNRQTKQIELFRLNKVNIDRRYKLRSGGNFFYGRVPNPSRDLRVTTFLEWVNGGKNYPGMPLPAGLVRVYRQESDGATFFLGEDRIGHLPQQEKVSINSGRAFDLTAEKRQTGYSKLSDRLRRVDLEITLTNRKNNDVVIEVEEALPGDWTMLEHSHEYEKIDARRIRFSPGVQAGGKTVVKYSIKFL